jgi:hypothetical protein
MVHKELQEIDRKLIEVGETLGELHDWLDNQREIDLKNIAQTLSSLDIPKDQYFLGKKRDSLAKHVESMRAFRTDQFTQICAGYFENLVPSAKEVADAERILSEQEVKEDADDKLKASDVAARIREAIQLRGLEQEVSVCYPYGESGVISIQPYLTKPAEIRISEKIQKSARAIQKTIAHEIEGHLYRLLNGRSQFPQSAFGLGTSAAYLLTEEGVTHQAELLNGFASNDRIAAAHIIAVNAMLADATENEINDLLINKGVLSKSAKNIAKRAKRGVDPDKKGGYVGGAAYLLGRIRVREFLDNGGSLNTLYIGKISLEDVPCVEQMLKSGELTPSKYTIGGKTQ